MKTIISGEYTFEIVESIPRNYFIWNIGKNMIDGYLPLCSLAGKQPFKGAQCIDVGSLRAIKIDEAQIILAAIGGGQCMAGSLSEAGKAIVVAGKAVVNAGASVAQKVAADAPEMLGKVKAGADSLLTQAKDALASVKGDEPEDGGEDATQPGDEEKPQE